MGPAASLAAAFEAEMLRCSERLPDLSCTTLEADVVHDTRVALRRIRSALRIFRPLLDAEWAAAAVGDLGWLAGQLDPLRDADVRRERFDAALSGLGDVGPALGAAGDIRAVLERERAAALASCRDSLLSPRRLSAQRRLEELLTDPRARPRLEGSPRAEARRLLERPWRDLRGAWRVARRKRLPAELHALRLRAKQLRYASALTAPVGGRPLERVAGACADLQGSLGAHHDAIDLCLWLAERSSRTELAFLAGQLYAVERRAAAVAVGGLDQQMGELDRRWRRYESRSGR